LARSLVEDLLEAYAALDIHPDGYFGDVLADRRVFGHQLQLLGLDAVEHLRAKVLDLPLVGEILAAGAEAEHQVAFELAGLGEGRDLVDGAFKELENTAGIGVNLGHGPAVVLGDVRGHLEGRAFALVIDRALLHVLVVDRIGLDGVKLEVGGGRVECLCSFVELAQDPLPLLFFRRGRSGNRRARHDEQHRDRRGNNNFSCSMHRFPYPVCLPLAFNC